jgi:iron complex outermembrane receptor protein
MISVGIRSAPRIVRIAGVSSLILILLGSSRLAYGQQAGQLSGSIDDQTGSALVGVTLRLHGAATREGHSDAAGRFEFSELPPGDYELSAMLSGFETAQRRVHIEPGVTASISVTLMVGPFEETVVTAAKIGAAAIQSTPLALSALSNAELGRLDIRTIDQAAALMPSVTFTQNGTFGQLSIRGIGTNAVNAGADPSSAIYLDGVYLARPAMVFADFVDLDRIEVLRGPQGTLYGRNAVGGAINLISRSPTSDFQAAGRVGAGNLDERRAEARVSGPLRRDRVLGSLAFARGTRDGFVRDLDHPDHRLGGDDVTSGRAQLKFLFGARGDLLVSTDLTDQDGSLLTFNKVLRVKPGFAVDNPPDLHDVRTSTVASSRLRQSGATARATLALSPATTLVSVTGLRRLDNEFLVDADITELALLSTHNHEWQRQFSEEVTVSHRQPAFTWVAGLFVFGEDDHQTLWVDQMQARTQVQLDPRVEARSNAAFGEATMRVTPRLSATAGFRITREGKDIDNRGGLYGLQAPMAPVPGTVYAYSDSIAHTASTPKFGIDLKLSPRTMIYVSATKGFKSGGFNLSSTQPGRGYAPERAWSYEGGLKTAWRQGRGRLSVAAFHMDYTDLQVQTPIGIGVFDIRNAAAATIDGVELEASHPLGRGLETGGHLAWLDATYDRYTAVAIGGITGDVAGNRLNNAPEWSGRLWIDWIGNIGRSRRVTLTADATAQSTVYYTPFNDDIQRQRPYGLIGARAEYGPRDRRWALSAYARNLTNADYIMATFATSPAAFGGRPGPSRQVAIDLTLRR